jgi:hypothetical protein
MSLEPTYGAMSGSFGKYARYRRGSRVSSVQKDVAVDEDGRQALSSRQRDDLCGGETGGRSSTHFRHTIAAAGLALRFSDSDAVADDVELDFTVWHQP